jgi:excinuclease UvrABC nuclease subunit
LLGIPGVGKKTAQKLLREFGSLAALREVSEQDLARVTGPAQAARIVRHFRQATANCGS